jgi:hypothetical protein
MTVDSEARNARLERRYQALEIVRCLLAPADQETTGLMTRTLAGESHSVDRIGNQFGAKLISAFLKPDVGDAWLVYRRLRPCTVGEEMAALLNESQFARIHSTLHEALAADSLSQQLTVRERLEDAFPKTDAEQFGGPSAGSLAELVDSGVEVNINPNSAKQVILARRALGDEAIPISEHLKRERILTLSGKRASKLSHVVHDLIDHIWTWELLRKSGVLARHKAFLESIGDPHERELRSREGEIVASISHGVRMFNTLEPGFVPVVRAERIARLLADHAAKQGSPVRWKQSSEVLEAAMSCDRFPRRRPTLESQCLSFVFSNYITELDEQRRKHGAIKRRSSDGVSELSPFDPDFLSFFVDVLHELMVPKNKHRNTVCRLQLMIEDLLMGLEGTESALNFVITLDGIERYDPTQSRVPPRRARWIIEHYGFAATTVALP